MIMMERISSVPKLKIISGMRVVRPVGLHRLFLGDPCIRIRLRKLRCSW